MGSCCTRPSRAVAPAPQQKSQFDVLAPFNSNIESSVVWNSPLNDFSPSKQEDAVTDKREKNSLIDSERLNEDGALLLPGQIRKDSPASSFHHRTTVPSVEPQDEIIEPKVRGTVLKFRQSLISTAENDQRTVSTSHIYSVPRTSPAIKRMHQRLRFVPPVQEGTSSPMELVVTKYDHESRTTANPSLFDPFKAMWPSIYNTNNYTVPKGWKQVWDDDEHFHFENLSTHETSVLYPTITAVHHEEIHQDEPEAHAILKENGPSQSSEDSLIGSSDRNETKVSTITRREDSDWENKGSNDAKTKPATCIESAVNKTAYRVGWSSSDV